MSPVFEIVAISSTAPSIRISRAFLGYVGCTFFSSNPCDTPCDTLKVCNIGLGALLSAPTRSGGGAPAPAVAIPIMLGAGASAAAVFECIFGTVPPLSTRGAAAAALLAAGEVEPEGFVELGAEASSDEKSVSSVTRVFAGTALGCELGRDVEVAGVSAGIAGAGLALLGFAACGTAT